MQRNAGFALIVVMWVVAILTVLTLALGKRAVLERRLAAYSIDGAQALYMARGAAVRGVAEVRNKLIVDAMSGKMGRTSNDQRWNQSVDLFTDEEVFQLDEGETENDHCFYVIEDAERRISVNRSPAEILENIETLSVGTVRRIVAGRENAEDQGRPQAFQSLPMVRTLDGIRDEDWRGTADYPGLKDMLTVWGDGMININTCSPEVLRCIPGLNKGNLETLIRYRLGDDGEFGTADDRYLTTYNTLRDDFDFSAEQIAALSKHCKIDSSYFRIIGFATQRQGKIRAKVVATIFLDENSTQLLDWREEVLDS